MDHNDFEQTFKTLTDLQNSNRTHINVNNEQLKINLQLQNRNNIFHKSNESTE